MLSRRIARASPLRLAAASRLPLVQSRTFIPENMNSAKLFDEMYPESERRKLTAEEDPEMNGGYVNPPLIKRQFRDPHADWWDKQERRNFGEPVHEEHDVLGMFTPHTYTWIDSPSKALFQVGVFIASILSVVYATSLVYPDKVAYPREFEDGLERELGGIGAVRARKAGDPDP